MPFLHPCEGQSRVPQLMQKVLNSPTDVDKTAVTILMAYVSTQPASPIACRKLVVNVCFKGHTHTHTHTDTTLEVLTPLAEQFKASGNAT